MVRDIKFKGRCFSRCWGGGRAALKIHVALDVGLQKGVTLSMSLWITCFVELCGLSKTMRWCCWIFARWFFLTRGHTSTFAFCPAIWMRDTYHTWQDISNITWIGNRRMQHGGFMLSWVRSSVVSWQLFDLKASQSEVVGLSMWCTESGQSDTILCPGCHKFISQLDQFFTVWKSEPPQVSWCWWCWRCSHSKQFQTCTMASGRMPMKVPVIDGRFLLLWCRYNTARKWADVDNVASLEERERERDLKFQV